MRKSNKPGHTHPTNHGDMVKMAAKKAGVPIREAQRVLTAYMESMQEELLALRPVTMHGVGTLTPPKCRRYNKWKKAVVKTTRFGFRPSLSTRTRFHAEHGRYNITPTSGLPAHLRDGANKHLHQVRMQKDQRLAIAKLVQQGAQALGKSGEDEDGE